MMAFPRELPFLNWRFLQARKVQLPKPGELRESVDPSIALVEKYVAAL
jgi:hypothetical protein